VIDDQCLYFSKQKPPGTKHSSYDPKLAVITVFTRYKLLASTEPGNKGNKGCYQQARSTSSRFSCI
jgi:hypothetical protein